MTSKVKSVAVAPYIFLQRFGHRLLVGIAAHLVSPLPAAASFLTESRELLSLRNNKKGPYTMFKHSKVRQAGLIVFATTLLLIVPNLTRVFG